MGCIGVEKRSVLSVRPLDSQECVDQFFEVLDPQVGLSRPLPVRINAFNETSVHPHLPGTDYIAVVCGDVYHFMCRHVKAV